MSFVFCRPLSPNYLSCIANCTQLYFLLNYFLPFLYSFVIQFQNIKMEDELNGMEEDLKNLLMEDDLKNSLMEDDLKLLSI